MEKEIFEVYLEDIIPNRFQPREKFDEEGIKELAESIKQYGIIQPLVLRKIGDKYEIIAGERRYKAATLAGIEKVPAIVKDLDDETSAEVALIENIQRQDLTPIEEARSYQKLLNMGDMTQERLAQKMGISQPSLANKLRLLNLDDNVQDAVLNNSISERHARSLLSLSSKEEQKQMLDRIINERLTVKQLDEEIKRITGTDSDVDSGTDEGEQKQLTPSFENVEASPVTDNQFKEMSIPEINLNGNIEQPKEIAVENSPELVSPTPIEEIVSDVANETIVEPNELDLEKVKEEAIDINPQPKKPNFDMLLKPDVEEVPTENIEEVASPKENYIESLDDEEANMDFSDNKEREAVEQPPIDLLKGEEPLQNDEIKISPLIQELREEKGLDNIEIQSIPEQKQEEVKIQANPGKDLRTAINTIRQCITTIEKYGFIVDSEEFDFEDMYQIIIKIDKGNK